MWLRKNTGNLAFKFIKTDVDEGLSWHLQHFINHNLINFLVKSWNLKVYLTYLCEIFSHSLLLTFPYCLSLTCTLLFKNSNDIYTIFFLSLVNVCTLGGVENVCRQFIYFSFMCMWGLKIAFHTLFNTTQINLRYTRLSSNSLVVLLSLSPLSRFYFFSLFLFYGICSPKHKISTTQIKLNSVEEFPHSFYEFNELWKCISTTNFADHLIMHEWNEKLLLNISKSFWKKNHLKY